MARKRKNKRNRSKRDGEIFYKAYPAAPAMGAVRGESHLAYVTERILWWALGIVEIFLLVRIIIAAFGANGGNILTSAVYAVTYPFVWFFFYLFNTLGRLEVTAPTFEIETLAAMAFYYIVIYIVTEVIKGFQPSED